MQVNSTYIAFLQSPWTHLECKPKIFVCLGHYHLRTIWCDEVEFRNGIYGEPILICFPGISYTRIYASIPRVDKPKRVITLASTKSKASDTNTIQATSDNIKALGNKICVYVGPCKPCPDFDGFIFAEDDVIEPGHRDVDPSG